MLFALVIAAAASSGAPSPTASDPPLREVVFHVSFTRRERVTDGSYIGLFIPRPHVQSADDSEDGTITVDVMAVAADTLGVRVMESWSQRPRTATFLGNIAPDGALHFGSQPLSEVALALLPMFGPKWMHDEPVDTGVKWNTKYADREADISTDFEVVSTQDELVDVRETQSVQVRSARGLSAFTTGTIVYKASLLVPVELRLERRASRGGTDDSDDETMVINVDRVSDTLDSSR